MTGVQDQIVQVFGHENEKSQFQQEFYGDRFPHGWLICGPRGIGKSLFARWAASLVIGAKTDRFVENSGRVRTVQASQGNSKREDIAIASVRELQSFLFNRVSGRDWRVVIFDSACSFNRNASNATLKILEEPPSRTVFFLIAHSTFQVTPTLVSRSRRLNLSTLSDQAMNLWYTSKESEGRPLAPDVISSARGRPAIAQFLLGEHRELWPLVLDHVTGCSGERSDSAPPGASVLVDQIMAKDLRTQDMLLGLMLDWLADALESAAHQGPMGRSIDDFDGLWYTLTRSLSAARSVNFETRQVWLNALVSMRRVSETLSDSR